MTKSFQPKKVRIEFLLCLTRTVSRAEWGGAIPPENLSLGFAKNSHRDSVLLSILGLGFAKKNAYFAFTNKGLWFTRFTKPSSLKMKGGQSAVSYWSLDIINQNGWVDFCSFNEDATCMQSSRFCTVESGLPQLEREGGAGKEAMKTRGEVENSF